MEYLIKKYLNRNYFFFGKKIYTPYKRRLTSPYHVLEETKVIFNLQEEEMKIIIDRWIADNNNYCVDIEKFWLDSVPYLSLLKPLTLSIDVADFESRITMMARYGSNTNNEDVYEVIRIAE